MRGFTDRKEGTTLLIKAYAGNGLWDLYEAHKDLRYLGGMNLVPVKDGDHDYPKDTRFPTEWGGEHTRFHVQPHVTEPDAEGVRYMRWATYCDDDGYYHVIVSDGPLYICNERGDTVEALK